MDALKLLKGFGAAGLSHSGHRRPADNFEIV